MNTELIAQTWQALGERQEQFVGQFYERLFERYPAYRKFFPLELSPAHLQKMARTVALLADLSEDRTDIAPRLRKLGALHKPFALAPRDFENFSSVFVEVLGRELGPHWSAAAAGAWQEAFGETLIPLMREGMA